MSYLTDYNPLKVFINVEASYSFYLSLFVAHIASYLNLFVAPVFKKPFAI